MLAATGLSSRWQLYRLLGEPIRLRLLALAAEEELALGELGELLGESQSNVSRHAAPLRQAGLLAERRDGTRTFVRLADPSVADPVVSDAVAAGRRLCRDDGSLGRIAELVKRRDARTREFFSVPRAADGTLGPCVETPAYLFAFASLLEGHDLAVDAGTGDGALLDVLAPLFRRVVAVDRSEAQLARAARRVAFRGYENVTLLHAELDDPAVAQAAGARASVVVASRMLHHAPQPRAVLRSLAALLRPAGRLFVIDYERHADEALRDRQADVWSGFEPEELEALARGVGLVDVSVAPLPAGFVQSAGDGHVGWQVLRAARPAAPSAQGPWSGESVPDGIREGRVSISAPARGRSRFEST